jgi:hypothetical protein
MYDIVTFLSVTNSVFGMEIGFIDCFNTRLLTILNYSAITNLHMLQITTTCTKSFQSAVSSLVVPWYWLLTVEILQLSCSLHCQRALNCTD